MKRWGRRAFKRRGNFINFFFDTDRDPGFERRLNIDLRRGELRARMQIWRRNGRAIQTLGRATLWRPDRRSVTVAFPRTLLGMRVTRYAWIGYSVFGIKGQGACGLNGDVYAPCTDRFPDEGRYHHVLS